MIGRWAAAAVIAVGAAALTWWVAGPAKSPAGPSLQVSLLAGSQTLLDAPGRVALPADTRFRVRATSQTGGVLELLTVNPAGQPGKAPLWTSAVIPGQTVESPDLRFDPPTGAETLTVRLRAGNPGAVVERVFVVWHP